MRWVVSNFANERINTNRNWGDARLCKLMKLPHLRYFEVIAKAFSISGSEELHVLRF